MNRVSRAVGALLLLNVAVFLAGLVLSNGSERVLEAGAFWFPTNEHFRPWQFVSYLFLHADFGHIFFNMFALASFGTILEREWGPARFLVFYFLCGIGAGLVQLGINWHHFAGLHEQLVAAGMPAAQIKTLLAMSPEKLDALWSSGTIQVPGGPKLEDAFVRLYGIHASPMLGASGAIYGVLVAFGLLYPHARLAIMFVPVPVAAKILIPIILGIDLLSGVTGISLFGAGVAHFAHLGGAAIGFLLMLLWRKRTREAPVFVVEPPA
ncbi:MAG TPA: rhomboid family intramembrane serine protease [Lacunisphaera sp.]|nr:rhomboid family intramembrane serine protease [Lacunisphaera sp.]